MASIFGDFLKGAFQGGTEYLKQENDAKLEQDKIRAQALAQFNVNDELERRRMARTAIQEQQRIEQMQALNPFRAMAGISGMSGEQTAPSIDSFTNAIRTAESNGRDFAEDGSILKGPVTRSGEQALGSMQVMPSTAMKPGFGIQPAKDLSPEELARVGREYAPRMIEEFGGDEAKAAAAYNAGPTAVKEAVARAAAKGTPDRWLEELPAQTQDYVPKVLGRAGQAAQAPAAPTEGRAIMMGGIPVTEADYTEALSKFDVSQPVNPAQVEGMAIKIARDRQYQMASLDMRQQKAGERDSFDAATQRAHNAGIPIPVAAKPDLDGDTRRQEKAAQEAMDLVTNQKFVEGLNSARSATIKAESAIGLVSNLQAKGGLRNIAAAALPSGAIDAELLGPEYSELVPLLNSFAVYGAPQGQGAVSDYERSLYASLHGSIKKSGQVNMNILNAMLAVQKDRLALADLQQKAAVEIKSPAAVTSLSRMWTEAVDKGNQYTVRSGGAEIVNPMYVPADRYFKAAAEAQQQGREFDPRQAFGREQRQALLASDPADRGALIQQAQKIGIVLPEAEERKAAEAAIQRNPAMADRIKSDFKAMFRKDL